jgi:hypothetical protein
MTQHDAATGPRMTEQHIRLLHRMVEQARASDSDIGLGANVLAALLDDHDRLRAAATRLFDALTTERARALLCFDAGDDDTINEINACAAGLRDALRESTNANT